MGTHRRKTKAAVDRVSTVIFWCLALTVAALIVLAAANTHSS